MRSHTDHRQRRVGDRPGSGSHCRIWISGLFLFSSAGCGIQSLEVGEGAAFAIASDEPDTFADEVLAVQDERELSRTADELARFDRATNRAEAFEPCDFRQGRGMVLAYYDFDGSGRLDPAELEALRLDMGEATVASRVDSRWQAREIRRANFRRARWVFDANDDGLLSQTERAALVKAMEARCQARRADAIARYDADGDGGLDPSELESARESIAQEAAARGAALLSAYDEDRSGALDSAERERLRADRLTALELRAAAVRLAYDRDRDGLLGLAERGRLRTDQLRRFGVRRSVAPAPRVK